MQRSALCRSRRELSNAYLLAKFRFDTAENEPCKVCPLSVEDTTFSAPRGPLGTPPQSLPIAPSRLATTHHSFLGSFSAVSKRNFATKYAFCSIFQNLQNYLADFLKKLQIFAKNRKILQNFCEISGFLQKKCWFLRKSLIFCKILQKFWKFSQIVL